MTENQQPPQRTGAWPTEPVDLDAVQATTAERQAEQEHGEQHARLYAAIAWNELVLDNIRIDLANQPNAKCARNRARWWIRGVLAQLDTVLKEGDR
ncbi:hypothetical protein F8R89_30830 [Streptomyces sp. SS1-1]|uniref:hypothetical protein n=1 Tax=Streptomyces sp. SS1-1 TaxID=2651869 RepID=UPI00125022DA|nr:hypothetical protein [Streptomyces sp. SS1-1]KAB2976004.1 hypothetical protein F8R89_30830 [Streptomyces sp. SS1-1]